MGQRRPKPQRLAAKLLAIRQGMRMSQSELIAKLRCDLTNARISEYESGARIPSLLTLLAYARVGGVTVEQLIDDRVNLP